MRFWVWRFAQTSESEPRHAMARSQRWSSYRGYAGYGAQLPWVWVEPLGRICGGKTQTECQRALREYTERAVRQGALEPPWARLIGGFVLGSEAFAQRLRRQVRGNAREQAPIKALSKPVSWQEILSALEQLKGCGRRREHVGNSPV
jgi:hypothetical protein